MKLKNQTYCILRLGIKKNKSQSFLELLASVYNYYKNIVNLPSDLNDLTLEEFKDIFIGELTIDKFIIAQNGILPTLFANDELEVDMENYRESKFISHQGYSLSYKTQIIRAFENFKNYINDDKEQIDYRYIWDLVQNQRKKADYYLRRDLIY